MAVLECKDLCKQYGRMPALDHVSFAVEPGHIVGLLGPNGSGKTTLIKLANGLLTPTAGSILVCGTEPGVESHAQVSYLPDRTAIPTRTFIRTSAKRRRRRCCTIWGFSPGSGSSR